jgi:hypothetical protein
MQDEVAARRPYDMSEGLAAFTFDRLQDVDEFGQMLRNIAKQSVMYDFKSSRLHRVCKAFDYCWELAYRMEHVEVSRMLLPVVECRAPTGMRRNDLMRQRLETWRAREFHRNAHLQRTIAPIHYGSWDVKRFQNNLPTLAEKKELHNRGRMLPAQPPAPPPPTPGDNEEALALLRAEMETNAAAKVNVTVVNAQLSQACVDATPFMLV